jgi:predicted nucleotidyltransferase
LESSFKICEYKLKEEFFMGYNIEKKINQKELIEFCQRNHIHKLSLFGSALRGELRPNSDIDLLVEFGKGHVPGLITLAGMEIELTKMFGRKADLRTARDLNRHFREEVIRTAEVQYEV